MAVAALRIASASGASCQVPTTSDLKEEDQRQQRAQRQVLQEPLPQFHEIHVEHHHDEEESTATAPT